MEEAGWRRRRLVTGRFSHAQLLVCATGCCCGRTDKRKPAVPVEWLKATWKRERLNKVVQLTITGCLGPCDVLNVACVVRVDGLVWLGGLTQAVHFETLATWAIACRDAGRAVRLPSALEAHAFERFPERARACATEVDGAPPRGSGGHGRKKLTELTGSPETEAARRRGPSHAPSSLLPQEEVTDAL